LETEDRMTALVANLPIKRTISGEIKFKKTDKTDKVDKSNKDIKK
jgi:cell division topological specificity factor